MHLTAKPTPKELSVREYLNNPIPAPASGYNAGKYHLIETKLLNLPTNQNPLSSCSNVY